MNKEINWDTNEEILDAVAKSVDILSEQNRFQVNLLEDRNQKIMTEL